MLLLATFGTLAVVGGGSLFKIAQLRSGGHVVAESLGGRRINSDTTSPSERQVLNVVEEMAIASGMPAPPVYVMDQEDSINAFAAGFTPNDAVVSVTRGTIEQLNRDELQGVIAHEFSHILNGDMRMNIRLMGLLNGILIIGMIGYFILRTAAFAGPRRRRSRDDGNPAALLALGAGLMAIGFFGTFFGNLIQAAVSRQREFLADASAVQFTRLPDGLAGALKKIGGLAAGSAIRSPNAPQASHLFFSRATSGFSSLFSTHPPLAERIRRIEPAWDGQFPPVAATPPEAAARMAPPAAPARPSRSPVMVPGLPLTAAGLITQIGQPSEAHLDHAARLVQGLPALVVDTARDAYGARAVVYALLLDRAEAVRRAQLQHLAGAADAGVYREVTKLLPAVDRLDAHVRLPVVELALPALRQLTADQYRAFKENVAALVEADHTLDLFEWSLQHVLLRDLELHHGQTEPARVRYRDLSRLLPQCEVLLSVLAHAGQQDLGAARAAFAAGRQALRAEGLQIHRAEDCGLDRLDQALATLAEATPAIKRQVIEAAAACVAADRQVTLDEAELLRAMSATLGCPMPPLVSA